ncbi:MAG: 6-bladed beta-propeller [Cyclobacteriaceae bacterium]|nr:6-bladed beta-propeller [Cyclobacteriaceae bacterium]
MKKKSLKLSGLIILLILTFACSKTEHSGMKIIKVPQSTDSDISLAAIAGSIETIPLETRENALIINVYDVKISDKKVFVKDRNNKILVFDIEGNYIKNLIPIGDGPGETKTIFGFTIDEASGKIYISDGRRLLVYSEEGVFLEERTFPNNLNYLTFLGNEFHAITEQLMRPVENRFSNETFLLAMNPQLEVTDSLSLRQVVLEKRMILGFHNRNFISRVGDRNYVYTPTPPIDKTLRDTLFHIDNSNLIPHIKLDFEAPHFDDKGNKAIMIISIILSKDYLLCEYDIESKRKFFLYDLKTSKGYNLDEGFFDEQGDKVVLRPLDLNSNVFYYAKSMEFMESASEVMNPVIGIVKLK